MCPAPGYKTYATKTLRSWEWMGAKTTYVAGGVSHLPCPDLDRCTDPVPRFGMGDRRLANMGNSVFEYGELWATPSTAQARPTREHPT